MTIKMSKTELFFAVALLVIIGGVIAFGLWHSNDVPGEGRWEDRYSLGANTRLLIGQMYANGSPVEGDGIVTTFRVITGVLEEEFVRTSNITVLPEGIVLTRGDEPVPPEEISWRFTLLPAQGEQQHDRETVRIVGSKDRTLVLKRDSPRLFVPRIDDRYEVGEARMLDPVKDEFLVASFYFSVNREIIFSPREVTFRGFFSSSMMLFDGNISAQEEGAPVFARRKGNNTWKYIGDVVGRDAIIGIIVQIAEKSLKDFDEIAYSTIP